MPKELTGEQKAAAEKKAQLDLMIASIKKSAQEAADKAIAGVKGEKDKDAAVREAAERAAARKAEDDSLDTMSRKDFSDVIYRRIIEHIQEGLNNEFTRIGSMITERMKPVDDLVAERNINEAAKEEYFSDFKADIADKIRSNPSLSALEALRLVKAENPERVKELSEKAAAEAKEKEVPMQKGGFFPGSVNVEAKTEAMKPAEAADAAWQSTFGNLPTSLYAGEQV